MLHVTNGDAAAEAIRSTGVDGDVLIWRDVLHEGPVPAAVGVRELREIRAGFLARCGWSTRAEALEDLARRDERLAKALDAGEEIVLWFEHDLFDQLQLLQVLDRLADSDRLPRISAVEVEQPVGGMRTVELIAAYARSRSYGAAELALGRLGWEAFRADDPRDLEKLAAEGTAELPALSAALRRLLQQFPGLDDGLSRTERQIVAVLADGPLAFEDLFERSQAEEDPKFLGDAVLELYLDRLAAPPAPLLTDDNGVRSLTERGRQVLAGGRDRLADARFDRWLGGVRLLAPRRVWRWDESRHRLVPPVAAVAAAPAQS
jgi:Domain of unknown function (DUF1835)